MPHAQTLTRNTLRRDSHCLLTPRDEQVRIQPAVTEYIDLERGQHPKNKLSSGSVRADPSAVPEQIAVRRAGGLRANNVRGKAALFALTLVQHNHTLSAERDHKICPRGRHRQ